MFDFDRRVDRTGMATVKQAYTPKEIAGSGVMSLWGAEFEFPTAPFVVDAVVEWAKKACTLTPWPTTPFIPWCSAG